MERHYWGQVWRRSSGRTGLVIRSSSGKSTASWRTVVTTWARGVWKRPAAKGLVGGGPGDVRAVGGPERSRGRLVPGASGPPVARRVSGTSGPQEARRGAVLETSGPPETRRGRSRGRLGSSGLGGLGDIRAAGKLERGRPRDLRAAGGREGSRGSPGHWRPGGGPERPTPAASECLPRKDRVVAI